jgi:hypothetical protein
MTRVDIVSTTTFEPSLHVVAVVVVSDLGTREVLLILLQKKNVSHTLNKQHGNMSTLGTVRLYSSHQKMASL